MAEVYLGRASAGRRTLRTGGGGEAAAPAPRHGRGDRPDVPQRGADHRADPPPERGPHPRPGQRQAEPFIAMELLEGRTLRRAAAEGRAERASGCRWASPCACSPRPAAASTPPTARWTSEGRPLRIVHRDFTPDNIHVGVSGEVKVIDFGIAKSGSGGARDRARHAQGQVLLHVPGDDRRRTTVDHRADLFAAGVMLYEQLCGRRPFTGLNTDEVLTRIAEGKPKRAHRVRPLGAPGAGGVCLTALAKDPTRRFRRSTSSSPPSRPWAGRPGGLPRGGGRVRGASSRREDPKRMALRRARLANPSTPTRSPDATAIDLLPPREESRPPRGGAAGNPGRALGVAAERGVGAAEAAPGRGAGSRGARAGGDRRRDRLRHPARALGRRPPPAGREGVHADTAHP